MGDCITFVNECFIYTKYATDFIAKAMTEDSFYQIIITSSFEIRQVGNGLVKNFSNFGCDFSSDEV
jgi:hypothetical protein